MPRGISTMWTVCNLLVEFLELSVQTLELFLVGHRDGHTEIVPPLPFDPAGDGDRGYPTLSAISFCVRCSLV